MSQACSPPLIPQWRNGVWRRILSKNFRSGGLEVTIAALRIGTRRRFRLPRNRLLGLRSARHWFQDSWRVSRLCISASDARRFQLSFNPPSPTLRTALPSPRCSQTTFQRTEDSWPAPRKDEHLSNKPAAPYRKLETASSRPIWRRRFGPLRNTARAKCTPARGGSSSFKPSSATAARQPWKT